MYGNQLLKDKLQPFFENEILTDIIYEGETMIISCLGDVGYIAFVQVKENQAPIGIPVPGKKYVKDFIKDEKFFLEYTSYLLKNKKNDVILFVEENMISLQNFIRNTKAKGLCDIDFEFNERLKRKYGGRTK